jgi:hypothetical protein
MALLRCTIGLIVGYLKERARMAGGNDCVVSQQLAAERKSPVALRSELKKVLASHAATINRSIRSA